MQRFPLTAPSLPTVAAVPYDKLRALEALIEQMSEETATGLAVRTIVEPEPCTGAWNMAVDEALLESVAAGGPPTLRLYAWSEATISLGYFQRSATEVEPGGRFHGLPVVRRLSGGGAILHHRELTYSCCIPAEHPLAGEPSRLYDELHRAVRQTLSRQGIEVAPRGAHEGDDKPFLCFARGDRRDLVCRGFKVVGSAQRRRRRAILQHGSILLRRSPFLPEFPGLCDLAGRSLDEPMLRSQLARACVRVLGVTALEAPLTEAEWSVAQRLQAEKYSPSAVPLMEPPVGE